jgi:hypothetical protein
MTNEYEIENVSEKTKGIKLKGEETWRSAVFPADEYVKLDLKGRICTIEFNQKGEVVFIKPKDTLADSFKKLGDAVKKIDLGIEPQKPEGLKDTPFRYISEKEVGMKCNALNEWLLFEIAYQLKRIADKR